MNISIITFTDKGTELAEKLRLAFEHTRIPENYSLITIEKRKKEDNHTKTSGNGQSLSEWTKEQFAAKNAIVFIGACGIAVRLIAPFVTDKLTDSPVVVLDEAGTFVIPLLSGHMGGANELAGEIAALIGAVPVITTATDVNQTFSVDVFAKNADLPFATEMGLQKSQAKYWKEKWQTL